MPKLKQPDWKTLVRIFEADGFKVERQKGAHIIMSKEGTPRPLVIPQRQRVSIHIVKSNMRTADMSRERYMKLLKTKR